MEIPFPMHMGMHRKVQLLISTTKSIVIQPGDTLWDIALEYKTDDYGSAQEYVDELKEINSLESDSIQESKYLMIAYYDEEFR